MDDDFESLDNDKFNFSSLFKDNHFDIKEGQVISFGGTSGAGKSAILMYLFFKLNKYNCTFLASEMKMSDMNFFLEFYKNLKLKNIKQIRTRFSNFNGTFPSLEKEIKKGAKVIFIDSVTVLFNSPPRTKAKAIRDFMAYLRELAVTNKIVFIVSHHCYQEYDSFNRVKIFIALAKYSTEYLQKLLCPLLS